MLAWDRIEQRVDANGMPVTRWDGVTTRKHPVTGEDVPDEKAVVPVFDYINPRQAEWPKADFVVGNPPFLGNKRMREVLGDGYAQALRVVFRQSTDADLVMAWVKAALDSIAAGSLSRAGLITTNSIRQVQNRGVVATALKTRNAAVEWCIPDHPWVDASDGAQVRVSMTLLRAANVNGRVTYGLVVHEDAGSNVIVRFVETSRIGPDLRKGADVANASRLIANHRLSFMGVTLVGKGFYVDDADSQLAQSTLAKQYLIGRDIVQTPRSGFVLDAWGCGENELLEKAPDVFQHLWTNVHPMRAVNKRDTYRLKWWLFGEPRPAMRAAQRDLDRFIVTPETSKHRVFVFQTADVVADHTAFVVASEDAALLSALSSRTHCVWAEAAGAKMGLGNDLRWRNVTCFEPFPFPAWTETQRERLRNLGEQLNAHRKARQALHPELTLTDMYNVLQKLRDPAQPALNPKERRIHDQGLVSVLRQIHDDIDVAVADAYGWPADLDDDALLERLVALNAERAAEEAAGHICWLRPEYQDPARRNADPLAIAVDTDGDSETETTDDSTQADLPLQASAPVVENVPSPKRGKRTATATTAVTHATAGLPWPSTMPEQAAAVLRVLQEQPDATAEQVAARFLGVKAAVVEGWMGVVRVMGR